MSLAKNNAGIPFERHKSSTPSYQNTDDAQVHGTQSGIASTPVSTKQQTSVCQIEKMFLLAAPRSNTYQPWNVVSDDECYYESKRITYVRFRPIKLKLQNDRKICHWGCLDADRGPTILSGGGYVPCLFLLTIGYKRGTCLATEVCHLVTEFLHF